MAPNKPLPFCYLEIVLAHSPKGYFSDVEMNIAKLLLSKTTMLVDLSYDEVDIMPHAIWFPTSTQFLVTVETSNDKTMAAVAQKDGTISVVCLPSLIELWRYLSKYPVSCCTFAPHLSSFVLLGKLESALSIVEKKEVPFFHGNQEMFESCAFSPNGKRLVTSDGSKTIRLWDVAKQNLLSLLHAEVPVNWCFFDRTGLFIIGNNEELNEEGSFCVWNFT